MKPKDHDGRKRPHPGRREVDGVVWETHTLPREAARAKAREMLNRYPPAGYGTEFERVVELGGDWVEFTMRWFSSAD